MKTTKIIMTGALLSLLGACGGGEPTSSKLKDAPPLHEDISQYGYDLNLFYDDIVRHSEFNYTNSNVDDYPWEDTYWPTYQRGIARRWDFSEGQIANTSIPALSQVLTDLVGKLEAHFTATSEQALWNLSYLSPAEKYDYLNLLAQKPADLDSAAFAEAFQKEELDALIKQVKAVEEALAADMEVLKENTELEEERKKTQANTRQKQAVTEMYDLLVNSQVLSQYPLFLQGWVSWAARAKHERFAVNASKPAAEGEINWAWEGLCHGWAAASIMEKKPLHSVLANINGKKVFFSEGDIRGLLTKAWANQAPPTTAFLSGRCNVDPEDIHRFEIEAFEKMANRPADGTVCVDWDIATGNCKSRQPFATSKQFSVMTENGSQYLAYEFIAENGDGAVSVKFALPIANGGSETRLLPFNKDSLRRYIRNTSGARDYTLFIPFDSFEELYAFAEEFAAGEVSSEMPRLQYLQFLHCRDTNPATFTAMLIQFFQDPDKPFGFVIDRTAESEVWNQPVFGYKMNLSEPIPFAESEDSLQQFRAPGTTYLVDAEILVRFIAEPPHPFFRYTEEISQQWVHTISIKASLELDKNQKLIGGEWGSMNSPYPEQQQPDFVYFYEQGSKPVEVSSLRVNRWGEGALEIGQFDANFMKQIHACSLDTARAIKEVQLPEFTGQWVRSRIPYVECDVSTEVE
ncbi:MAG: hypothetical protein ACOH5I_08340 [Oligoflexus sp.]